MSMSAVMSNSETLQKKFSSFDWKNSFISSLYFTLWKLEGKAIFTWLERKK